MFKIRANEMFWDELNVFEIVSIVLFGATFLEFSKSFLGLMILKNKNHILRDHPIGRQRTWLSLSIGILEFFSSTIDGIKVILIAKMPIYYAPALGVGIGLGTAISAKVFKPMKFTGTSSTIWWRLREPEETEKENSEFVEVTTRQ